MNEEEKIELLGTYGAENLEELINKSTPDKLKFMEMKYKFRQELNHVHHLLRIWETGYTNSSKFIISTLLISATISYLLGNKLAEIYLSTKLSTEFTVFIYLTSITISIITLFDLGKLIYYIRGDTTNQEEEEEEDETENETNNEQN